MPTETRDVWTLIQELEERMRSDYQRMRRWRNVHRVMGVVYTTALLVLPPILAVGFVSSETFSGKIVASIIAIVGGLNAAFQPMLHSYRRRTDMNNSRQLLDAFHAAVAKGQSRPEHLATLFKVYAQRFAQNYAERGGGLVDSTFFKKEGTP
jgi:hypothetical protein